MQKRKLELKKHQKKVKNNYNIIICKLLLYIKIINTY